MEELANEGDGVNNIQGVKFDSVFNDLNYYHVCRGGLPPCLGHDLFEGVVNYDVALILQQMIRENKWFTYSYLNRRISSFKYAKSDKSNQPSPIQPNADKLGGQAVQNWCLVRLLPLLIGNKICEPADDYWQLFLRLREIIDLVCAPQITESQIAVLNCSIDDYLDMRFNLFPNHRMKPKHHFMKHYPSLILQHGPLMRSWTMRFESKHSYFKQCVRRLHNFKSVCSTLTEKHQLLQAYRCAGAYFPIIMETKQAVSLDVDTYTDAVRDALVGINACAEDQITYQLTLLGTTYRKGDYLPVEYDDNTCMLSFGEIIFILMKNVDVYFVVRIHNTEFNPDLQVYLLCDDRNGNRRYACVKSEDLLDYYPLPAYKIPKVIPLKHAISCDFL